MHYYLTGLLETTSTEVRKRDKMKYFLIIISFILFSCADDAEGPPFEFPVLKMVNVDGLNLLNPSDSMIYDISRISGYFVSNKISTGEIEMKVSNRLNYLDSQNYYLYIYLDHRVYKPVIGINTLVIKLSESEMDTLFWSVGQKNGAEYTTDLTHTKDLVIHQNTSDNFLTWIKE